MTGSVLSNRSSEDRIKTDFYQTPPDVTRALVRFLEDRRMLVPLDVIWEPACGTGEMAEVLMEHGYTVICSDLYPTGYTWNVTPVNFLTESECCDWIITNPPFSQAEAFIRHALELGNPCAFLLKSQFWHAKKRLELFRESPPTYVLPLTWRPDFLQGKKSGSPTMEVLWTVWAGKRAGTMYIPLEKPGGDT